MIGCEPTIRWTVSLFVSALTLLCFSSPRADGQGTPPAPPANAETKTQSWLEAVRDGIAEEMRRDPHIAYFGEGTGERGGTFAHTKGLWQEFGSQRMVDTPISEQAIVGMAVGAAMVGMRPVAEIMFNDFAGVCLDQIFNHAAKQRYM